MKRLVILGAICALALARPELYKEKEDFQYSRSSSDDGTKSGYYGAQRGNMGGNYERAHNMDSLAQNQMSGLVRQVEGELGEGANTRSGSVFTAANSRGTYGSGRFDLSNLAGRNFQEGGSFGDSRSSLSSSAHNSAGYAHSGSQSSRHDAYHTAGHSGVNLQSDNLQSLDNLQGSGQYDYGRHSSHSAGYHSQAGFQEHSEYDHSNTNSHSGGYGSNVRTRLISAVPVRIVGRPGTRVAIPVAANTYDVTQGSSLVDQNALNSEAEILSNDNQRTVYRPTNAKHYESSYNYRKEWEKHDTIPVTIPITTPTENPFPKNSELYEDSKLRTSSSHFDTGRVNSQRAHSSNSYSGYNANVKSGSSQTSSNYDSQLYGATTGSLTASNARSIHHGAGSDSSLDGYVQAQHNSGSRYHGTAADANSFLSGYNTDLNSQVEDLNVKPRSYQSAYSYHKSWERQGDPYIIKPASGAYYDAQSSTKNQGYAIAGSNYQHSHQGDAECDESGHIRVARSYNLDQFQQQSQNIEDLGQQVEDLGQLAQSNWDQQEVGQQSQNSWDKIEDLGQQTQNNWGQQEVGQQSQNTWDRIEDLGQQTQSNWGQQEAGLQSQNSWQKIEDLGQQTQSNWGQQEAGQQSQNSWDQAGDLNQQSQNKLDRIEDFGQHTQNDLDQQTQKSNSQDINQQTDYKWNLNKNQDQDNVSDQNQDYIHENSSNEDPKTLNKTDITNFDLQSPPQASANSYHKINSIDQTEVVDKQPHSSWPNSDVTSHLESNNMDSSAKHLWEQSSDNVQQIQTYNKYNQLHIHKKSYPEIHKQEQVTSTNSYVNSFDRISTNTKPLSNLWNKLDNIEQQSLPDKSNKNKDEESYNMQENTSSQTTNLSSRQDQSSYSDSNLIHHYSQVKPHSEYPPLHPLVDSITQSANTDQKERSQDAGRGDIGPEASSEEVIENKTYTHPLDAEISKENIQNRNLSNNNVLSFDEQKSLDQDKTPNKFHGSYNFDTDGETEITNQHTRNVNDHLSQQSKQNDFNQQNLQDSRKKDNLEPHLQDFEQQNLQDFGQQNLQVPGQQNLQDFGQQNLQDFEPHHLQESGQHNLQDFGQQNLQDFYQQNMQNFNQQNSQYFREHENSEQHLLDFGQQQQNVQDFGQQTLQYIGYKENHKYFQDSEYHPSLEKEQLQISGQNKPKQQNTPEFTYRGTLEQQFLDQQQNSLNVDQLNSNKLKKSLHEFGQHNFQEYEPQNLHDFDQKTLQEFGNNDKQKQKHIQDIELHQNQEQHLQVSGQNKSKQLNTTVNSQQVDLNQKEFDQHNLHNLDEQSSQNLKKHNNLEQVFGQQNLADIGQQSGLDFADSGKHHHTPTIFPFDLENENQEQEYFRDIEHHQNGEQKPFDSQHNIPDYPQEKNQDHKSFEHFGHEDIAQREKFEQQSFHHYDLHDSDQKTLHDYEQHQNLHDFGHVNLDQQNLNDFGQQSESLDQQFLHNLEQLNQHPKHELKYSDNIEKEPRNKYHDLHPQNVEDLEVEQKIHTQKQYNDLHAISSPETETISSQPVTEKSGFWNSIGSKFSSAKSKIASWFHS